jgi:transcriptional regulator with XRE-family HTH domain
MKNKLTPFRRAILENGSTQREVAAKSGIHESIISLIASGRYLPDSQQRIKIANALGRYENEIFPESCQINE